MAAVIAARRKVTSDMRRERGDAPRGPEHYNERPSWDQEIECSLAEIAVSRWRNRYWNGAAFSLAGPGSDAGSAQVRWTEHASGHLIVYTEDKDDDPFVLVTGAGRIKRIVGWCWGREAKEDRFWREDVRCPSWWVPQSYLKGTNGNGGGR